MRTKILYEDQELLVVHKPIGLATQTQKLSQPDVVSEMKNHVASVSRNKTGEPYLGLIHRLDQPVEGILLLAKTEQAAKELNIQLLHGKIKKSYYAVVFGQTLQQKATLVDYLCKNGKTNTSAIVSSDSRDAKRAELHYEVLAVEGKETDIHTLVRVCLETGRHHQIRVQMAHAGLPLLGDYKYGTEDSHRASMLHGIQDVALCAYAITLQHPITHCTMSYQIEPSAPVFSDFIGKF
ncbi:MAG: RluA family pseudouridine synthase [Lachnospiraceae bacterium]